MAEKKAVKLIPNWETAVMVHLMAIDNPDAPYDVKEGAKNEILRLARAYDEVVGNPAN